MIDFSKLTSNSTSQNEINPVKIFDQLDRKSFTGPLRSSQIELLKKWHNNRGGNTHIIKLHTGEGKTLIGLLALQSKLNEFGEPVLYVCANKLLLDQTIEEANKFGINYCLIEDSNQLPLDFINGKKMLISYSEKVFNGKSIFKKEKYLKSINTILLDDAHTIIEVIKKTNRIEIKREDYIEFFKEIFLLFEEYIKEQSFNIHSSIINEEYEEQKFCLIPYWAIKIKYEEFYRVLKKYSSIPEIDFNLKQIENDLEFCNIFISNNKVEISNTLNPVSGYDFYINSKSKIIMTATTQNIEHYITDLNILPQSIEDNCLESEKNIYSGEKLILSPESVCQFIDRGDIINLINRKYLNLDFGVFTIIPRTSYQNFYPKRTLLNRENQTEILKDIKSKKFHNITLLNNKYEGVDLPDDCCRILIIDDLPYARNFTELYEEENRSEIDYTNIKIIQKIEQGLGRSVRGEKDYSVVILLGKELARFINVNENKKMFSPQTAKQLEIGEIILRAINKKASEKKHQHEISEKVIEEISDTIDTVLNRDEGWKRYYTECMESVTKANCSEFNLKWNKIITKVNKHIRNRDYAKAIHNLRSEVDGNDLNIKDKAWFSQLLAKTYYFNNQMEEFNTYQANAYRLNSNLIKPQINIKYNKFNNMHTLRVEKILNYISGFLNPSDLYNDVYSKIALLNFTLKANTFEQAIDELGKMLGFDTQRPDKEIGKGPDNLWLSNGKFLLIECKNEVVADRAISKTEIGQLHNHINWLKEVYGKDSVFDVLIIHPNKNISKESNIINEVRVIRRKNLAKFKDCVLAFYDSFKDIDISSISSSMINKKLDIYKLTDKAIIDLYTECASKL